MAPVIPQSLDVSITDETVNVGGTTTLTVAVRGPDGVPAADVPVQVEGAMGCALGHCGAPGSGSVSVQSASRVIAIAASSNGGYALRSDGTVWQWSYTAQQVQGVSDVVAIAAGAANGYAVEHNGTVWDWGWGYTGQLGTGSTAPAATPVKVKGLPAIAAIASGYDSVFATASSGGLWEWGWNGNGELGDGATTNLLTPQPFTALPGIGQISAGYVNSFAIANNGTLWAWGRGYGNHPQQIPGVTDAAQAAEGQTDAVIRLTDGTVAMLVGDALAPVQGLTDVTQVAEGSGTMYALRSDGTVWAWGLGTNGELGNGTRADSQVPVEVSGLHHVVAIAAGLGAGFALQSDGTVWAWGVRNYVDGGPKSLYGYQPVQIQGIGATGQGSNTMTTDAQGVARVTVRGTSVGAATIEVDVPVPGSSMDLSAERTVTVLPAGDTPADIPASVTMGAGPAVQAPGAITVTARVVNAAGQPIDGAPVSFLVAGGTAQLQQTSPVLTDKNGIASDQVSLTQVGKTTIRAAAAPPGGSGAWASGATTVVALPQTLNATLMPVTIRAVPELIGVSPRDTFTVLVVVNNADGAPVAGVPVVADSFSTGAGQSNPLDPVVSQLTTNGNGTAQFSFTATAIGTATIRFQASPAGYEPAVAGTAVTEVKVAVRS